MKIRLGLLSLAVGAMSLMGLEARAQVNSTTMTFELPNITLSESSSVQTGYFNAVVYDTNTSDQVTAFDTDVTISGSQVGFTNADFNTSTAAGMYGPTATYVLASSGGTGAGTGVDYNSSINVTPPPSGNNEAYNTDTSSSDTLGQNLSPTTPYGLVRVEFTVPANTVGDFTLGFVQGVNWNDTYLVGNPTEAVLPILQTGSLDILANPTVSTTAGESGSAVGSALLSDAAVIANGVSPTGTITFTLTAPNASQTQYTVSVNGNGTYDSPSVTATQVGSYTWSATYNGDSQNNTATDNGSNESLTTIKATPGFDATASQVGHTVGTAILNDTATVTGGYLPGGSIEFQLTGPNSTVVSTQYVTVTGDGSYSPTGVLATQIGTYTWSAIYGGDVNNNSGGPSLGPLSVSAVPEPSSWALAALAVVGGVGLNRFRRPRARKA